MTKRLPWFKCYPEKLLGAISMMKPDEQLLYVIVLLRIYETSGMCRDGFDDLTMRSRIPAGRATVALESLIAKKKLHFREGQWSNPVAELELAAREERSETSKMSAQARWEKHKQNQHTVDADALPLASEGNATKTQSKKERKKDSRPAKQQDTDGYPVEFEALWKAYPRTKGTSKKKAHDLWRMLNDVNRERVRLAVPIYADQMRRENREEDKIKHMETWLRGKVYETLVVPPGETNVVQIPWHKTATREQWLKVLQRYESSSNWSPSWGPAPGKEGCGLPDDLVAALPYYLHPDRDLAAKKPG